MLGALLAQDLALFVLFFDLMLVPFLLPGRAVGARPEPGAPAIVKLFIYTLVGSLLMLAGGDRRRPASAASRRACR